MSTQLLGMAALGAVTAGVAWFLSPQRSSRPLAVSSMAVKLVGTAAVLAVGAQMLIHRQVHELGVDSGRSVALAWGLLVGFVLIFVVHLLGRWRELNAAVSLGLAGAAVATLGLVVPEDGGRALAAAAVAAGVSCVSLRGAAESRTGLLFLFAALSGIMAREAVAYSPTWQVGVVFTLAGAVGACAQAALAPRAHRYVALSVAFAAALGIGALGAYRYLYLGDLFMLLLAGMAVGAALLIVGEEDSTPPNAVRLLLCALIVLGAGAWAFSLRHGFGMSTLLVSSGVAAVLLGSSRAQALLSPLLSLVLLRVFIEWTGGGSAVDLAQHYVLMGFAAGALLPLVAVQWDERGVAAWAGTLWQALVVGVPALAAVFLGKPGASGFLFGLMLCPIASLLLGGKDKEYLGGWDGMSPTLLCGCAGLVVVFAITATPEGLVSRSAKVSALLFALAAIVVLSWLLALSTRGRLAVGSEVSK